MRHFGHATFSSSLKIKGTSKVTSDWNVQITNITKSTFSGSAEESTVDGVKVDPTCSDSGTPKLCEGLSASINVDLYEIGDSAEYDITISNKGNIDAKLDDIIVDNSKSNNAVLITYSGYSKGERLFKKGSSGSSKTIHVKVAYNPEYTGEPTSSEINLTFNYVQAEAGTIPDTNTYVLTYDYQTNGGNKSNETAYYDEGENVDLTKTDVKEGYSFVGWNTDSSATTGLATFSMPSNNTTLYAIYEISGVPPVIDSFSTTHTINSITAYATAHDDETSITKYEFSSDDGEHWVDNGMSDTYTFTDLTIGKTYNVKVRVTNGVNIKTTSETISVTPNLPVATFIENISSSNTTVEITYPEGCSDGTYTCTYQKNSETTLPADNTTLTGNKINIEFTESGTIIGTVSDGTNTVSSSYTVTISNTNHNGTETYDTAGSYTFTAPATGEYYLQVWGAQGGSYSATRTGGKGGYSYGTITLNEGDTLYINTGGQPTGYNSSATSGNTNAGGSNGGGTGRTYAYSGTTTYSLGGGGASDIRVDANKDGTASLYERIIVAGGGSGSSNQGNGYAGGGVQGLGYNDALKGKETSAGTGGSFGQGGPSAGSYNYKYGPPGGGGGWYGGGRIAGQNDSNSYYGYAAGGGSGYVYTSSTASNYPSGCLLTSDYYLTDAATIAGNTSFESPSGGTETGHSGNGYVKITYDINNSVNDKAEQIPTLSTTHTTNSITAILNTTNVTDDIVKYEFSKNNGSTWVQSNNNSYVFNSLETGTYSILGRVTTDSGLALITNEIEVTLNEIELPTYAIEYSVENDNVIGDVTITYPDVELDSGTTLTCSNGLTCTYTQYDSEDNVIDSGTVSSKTKVLRYSSNGYLEAYITDGTNTVSNTYTVVLPDKVSMGGQNIVTTYSGDGLYKDDNSDDDVVYVYRGADPANYIKLGSDLYRIMSIDTSGNLKVIRDTPFNLVWDPGYSSTISGITSSSSTVGTRYSSTSTDYCYYTSESYYYGCNSWGSKTSTLASDGTTNVTQMPWEAGSSALKNLPTYNSYMNVYLNGGTYRATIGTTKLTSWYSTNVDGVAQGKMVEHLWNVGPLNYNNSDLATDISQESTYKWKGKVGLMNPTDFVRASTNSACTNVYQYKSNSSCNNNSSTHNWLYKSSEQWTLVPYSGSTAFFVWAGYGGLIDNRAYNSYSARPVLYLSSSIQLSGTGADSDNAFTIVG